MSTQYTVDNNDRLVQAGGTLYTHDANGNTLTETLDAAVTTYSYNAKNEMIGSSQSGVDSVYLYNTDGIRIGKGDASEQTLFTVDTNRAYAQVITEVLNGTEAVTYIYGDDLLSQNRTSTISTYLYDGLGSTRALSNDTGSITDQYDYDAFGELLHQVGSTENDYLFTGEQFDGGLDQYYLRARYYDQAIGRFTQMDTWMGRSEDPVTLHKYLYGNVDPVNNIDPTGNFSIGSMGAVMSGLGTLSRLSYVGAGGFLIGDYASGGRQHTYEFFNKICNIGDRNCDLETVYLGLRHFPAPVTNWQLGLSRPLIESGEQLELVVWSPVWTTANGKDSIRNTTLKGHIFYNGIVDRKVVRKGNSYYIRSYGEGSGSLAASNILSAQFLWIEMARRLSNWVEGDRI